MRWGNLPIRFVTLATAALSCLTMLAGPASAQDATVGEKVFRKCMACHKVGANAKNGVGPQQNGIVGRTAGAAADYKYSALNKAAGEAGLVWTEETIFNYLPDPDAFLKKFLTDAGKPELAVGRSKMTYKLKDEQERKDVVAYLKTLPAVN